MCKVENPNSRTGHGFYPRHSWQEAVVDGHARQKCVRCGKLNPVGVPPEIRFWDHVDKSSSPSGCWLWIGRKGGSGSGRTRRLGVYGLFNVSAEITVTAHRYAWEILRGSLSEDKEPDHTCKVTACVNPDHLEPVTHRENMNRALRFGYCKRGHKIEGENAYRYISKGIDRQRCLTCFKRLGGVAVGYQPSEGLA